MRTVAFGIALMIGWAVAAQTAPAEPGVALPTLSGPLTDTATRGVLVWNTRDAGYVAEEYLVSGDANVYEPVNMADAPDMRRRDNVDDMGRRDFSRPTVKTGQPYTTRIVVYRPQDPARFSGNVIVETLHPLGGGTGIVWSQLNGYFVAHGDAYVGVQHPATFAGLKDVDAERYGALSMPDYTQLWGSLAQIGAALKNDAPGSPLHGYAVKYLFMTGYSFTGVATATFANFHHAAARLADGRHVYDGYLPQANSMYNRPIDVPVIRLNTQSDFDSFGGLGNRRADSDAKGGRYRLYEVAGAPHVTVPSPDAPGVVPPGPPPNLPAAPNQPQFSPAACASQFPEGARPNDFPLYLVQAAMFEHMYAWVREHAPPPRAPRIATNADGTTKLDANGNALGGLRLPQVSVPLARYGVGKGDRCFLFGYKVPLQAPSRSRYETAVDRTIDGGWVLPAAKPALMKALEIDPLLDPVGATSGSRLTAPSPPGAAAPRAAGSR